jgi:hypothetical protein
LQSTNLLCKHPAIILGAFRGSAFRLHCLRQRTCVRPSNPCRHSICYGEFLQKTHAKKLYGYNF